MAELKNRHTFVILLLIIFFASVVAASPPLTMSSHCPSKCGHVTIPYPFGSGRRDCFFDEWYEVVCQNGIPRMKKTGLEISHISLDSFRGFPVEMAVINVSVPITHSKGACGSDNTATLFGQLEGSHFFVSMSFNVLAVVGCNLQVSLKNHLSEIVGCSTKCNSNNSLMTHCSGIDGCCYTGIQNSLQSANLVFQVNTTPNLKLCDR